ncbi:hypothetical protein [Pseudalkalibacillus caeni]|uniref:Lipoprotein n=1 Tax=Exobacillus caeni TaxID=2574798 RepID=A0A5R9F344_9BACL|nr:hypothetical protein [Pseudalkalibacillus caeni]TLS36746.1 hypothetical protein FCL54_12335 [Pseudalkalibacillus caeni]
MYKTLSFVTLLFWAIVAGCSNGEEQSGTIKDPINVEVSAEPVVNEDNSIKIKGETNIPDGAELYIAVTSKDIKFKAEKKVIVKNGSFETEKITNDGKGLKEGTYYVNVTLPIHNKQPDDFISKVGKNYKKLQGELMEEDELGKTMSYEEKFVIES